MDNICLREQLVDAVNDLETATREIIETLLTDARKTTTADKSFSEKLRAQVGLFNQKQEEFTHLLSRVKEHQQREHYIRALEELVESRDELINRLAVELKSVEAALMEATFQAEKKLRSVKQSETNRVFSEDVIRFAYLISKNYSVASSAYWQHGDQSRPYPTEAVLGASNLLLSRTQPNAYLSQNQPSGMLPNALKSSAIFNVPGMPQKPFSPSPRSSMFASAMGATSGSPRGRPPGTGARMPSPSGRQMPKILQRTSSQQSPRFSQLMMPGQPQFVPSSPSAMVQNPGFASPNQSQMLINLPSNMKQLSQPLDVQRVEQMSSESSSSSSSGDEASPNGQ